jgi:hypothetical protein
MPAEFSADALNSALHMNIQRMPLISAIMIIHAVMPSNIIVHAKIVTCLGQTGEGNDK